MALDMHYAFRVAAPGEKLSIAITATDADGPMLTAVHTARRRELSDAALARAFVSHPLLTLKVVGGILWEALRLWCKGIAVHTRPAAPENPVTVISTR